MEKKFLTRQESADYLSSQGLPTTKATLEKLASVGGGPPYQIYRNKALYTPNNLISWAESKLSSLKADG